MIGEFVLLLKKFEWVNSETEATMSVLRMDTPNIKFKGCYHSHADYL